jgi:hypothetical protein
MHLIVALFYFGVYWFVHFEENVKGVARRKEDSQSEAKERRYPPLPPPSCSPLSLLWTYSWQLKEEVNHRGEAKQQGKPKLQGVSRKTGRLRDCRGNCLLSVASHITKLALVILSLLVRRGEASLIHLICYREIVAVSKYPMPKTISDQMNKK